MTIKRLIPVSILILLAGTALWFRVDQFLTLEALKNNRELLLMYVAEYRMLAGVSFLFAYALVVALSLPGATIMTLAGGFLFGAFVGTGLTVLGATLGAGAVFLIAKSALGETLKARAGPFLDRMAKGFQDDAFSYLLFLRLVPAFPFWAVNLAPALLGVRILPYIAATAIGIIPGTAVFSAFGAGLGEVFDSGAEVSLRSVISVPLLAGLVGLGFLSLLPILLKRWKR